MNDSMATLMRGRPLVFGFACAVAMTLLGCPYGSDLEDAEQYWKPDEGCSLAPSLLEHHCGGSICHTGPDPDGSIDLVRPGFEDALLTATATYNGVPSSESCPDPPARLIDAQDPHNSWLLKKIRGDHMSCGTSMPPVGRLSADETECIEQWITQLVAERSPE